MSTFEYGIQHVRRIKTGWVTEAELQEFGTDESAARAEVQRCHNTAQPCILVRCEVLRGSWSPVADSPSGVAG